MSVISKTVEIIDVQFIGNSAMMLFLSNDRSFIIPLDNFEGIKNLTSQQRLDFEVIDGENLSFLAVDEIYNIHELTGL
jgi:uncharacterized membrane protein YqhA